MGTASADKRILRRIKPIRELHNGARHIACVDPLQIDEQLHGHPRGVRVAVYAHARRGGQLHVHPGVREGDRVESGTPPFRAEVFRKTPRARIGREEVVRERQQAHILKVRTTRAAQVRLGKSVDAWIIPYVAGTVVPVA